MPLHVCYKYTVDAVNSQTGKSVSGPIKEDGNA